MKFNFAFFGTLALLTFGSVASGAYATDWNPYLLGLDDVEIC